MKILLKFIKWLNKRRLTKLEAKIMSINGSKEKVLFLAEMLEKELIENYGLIPNKNNSDLIMYTFYRHNNRYFEIQHLPYNSRLFITISSEK